MSQANDPITQDDPRLTAYALGELEAAEVPAFEALLASDPSAQSEVNTLRLLADDLEFQLGEASDAAGVSAGLDAERRASVTHATTSTPADSTSAAAHAPSAGWGAPSPRLWAAVAMAACVLVGLPVLSLMGEDEAAPSKVVADGSGEVEYVWDVTTASISAGSGPGDRLVGGAQVEKRLEQWSSLRLEQGPAHQFNGQPFPLGYESGSATRLVVPVAGSGAGTSGFEFRMEANRPTSGRVVYGIDMRGLGGRKPGSLVRLDDVTNGLENASSAGRDNAGAGLSAAEALNPTAGAYFNDSKDGTFRGRTENVFGRLTPYGRIWSGWTRTNPGEQYVHPGIDGFLRVTKRGGHTSTFSVDVDTASYSNVRRILNQGQRPHPAAVRIEEFVNYFDYGYKAPADDAKRPFATHVQIASCPWNPKHRLARIALKGKEFKPAERPASNLVFLIDVSGSMKDEDKLPLLQSGLEMLVENLDKRDRVSIITYSSSASRALETTTGDQKAAILASIRGLKAGGSTNGAAGIQMAYEEAKRGFLKEGVNRVILCTDGDFNVGVSDGMGLTELVKTKAEGGVYLSVLGFGTGNLQDGKMEAYSNAGNGNYAYLDSLDEAKRVLVDQMQGTLITIAKDVKFQVWFNPKTVVAWRLLGYENRRLAAKDFNDDSKDAGDIGAGHEVTALYELVPTGVGIPGQVDANPFIAGTPPSPKDADAKKAVDEPKPQGDALFVWCLRWKAPDGDTSELVEQNVFDAGLDFEKADGDFQWAAAVTAFGMQLRHSPHRGQTSFDLIEELAKPAQGEDPKGRRAEFLALVAKAKGK